MKLSDDVFLQEQQPPVREPRRRLTSAELAGLRGIGDRYTRETQDYFASEHGVPLIPNGVIVTPNGRFSAGDSCEFNDPMGARVAGRIKEISPSGAIVEIRSGEMAFVPIQVLEPYSAATRTSDKRTMLRLAMRGSGVGTINETRAPLPVNGSGRDFAITLQGWNVNKPTEEEVLTYIAQRYPGARVLDADTSYPGNKIGVVITFPAGFEHEAQGMIPMSSPKYLPHDKPEGAGISQEFVDDDTGGLAAPTNASKVELERRQALLEKTGEAIFVMAELNPSFDFFETSIEVEADRMISHFAIQHEGAPAFLRAANGAVELTAILSQGSAPAVGYVAAENTGKVTVGLFAPNGEVPISAVRNLRAQKDMFSPVTTPHEEEAMTSYADVEVEGAPPARGRGKPMEYYTKEKFEDEMARYRNEQQRQLLQEDRAKQLRTQNPGGPGADWIDTTIPPAPTIPAEPTPDWLESTPMPQDTPAAPAGVQPDWLETQTPRVPGKYPPAKTPDWLEGPTPLYQQVKGDADVEHLGGPGLQVAERAAADKTTKDYWTEYFDTPETKGYGEDLTDEVTRKKDARATIAAAWKEANVRLTAAHLFRGMQILLLSPTVRVAQMQGDLASSLMHSRQTDPSAANAIDKLVADYLARNTEVLEQLGVYDQALKGAVQYWEAMQPKRLEKLRSKYAPEQDPVGTAGQPGMIQQLRDRFDPQQRLQREVDTGAHGPMTPAVSPEQQALEDSFDLDQPAPGDGAPATPEVGEMNLEFEPDPVVTPLPPASAPGGAPPGDAKKPPRAPKPRKPFTPSPQMQLFDDRGQPVAGGGPGTIIAEYPSGTVRYKTDDGRVLMAFPPGVPTPAGGAPAAAAPATPAAPPPAGGIGQRIKQRLMGASKEAASHRYDGDDDLKHAARDFWRGQHLDRSPDWRSVQDQVQHIAASKNLDATELMKFVQIEAVERFGPILASKQAYRPLSEQYTADDPTPGTYNERTPAENYPGRRPPAKAELNFQLENLRRRGDYVVGDVLWDPDLTKDMSSGNVQHNIVSFVKGQSTIKAPIDLGNIGKVRVLTLDVHAGLAEVAFRSSEARAVPPEQIVTEEGVKYRDPIS